ncbi:chondroitin AC/alginate lyase [Stereum hirsutum FP-91666 SS1]|uniref:chondroitin AC/alginate lyase n=1 Tax=Stereum hirsutum (strain FP-91666) TaxID=721885 RepID=UPI000440D880|nr:chondroitin AC/alginate lyase [Stereum hirsutum FP-91666 SS1]EIM92549.1 chondroitin AC/alginate lyase [Stereum hirsutum FP-91666 SS1]
MKYLLASALLLVALETSLADPNDWVNIEYVVAQGKNGAPATADARRTIANGAKANSKDGPWSVAKNAKNTPPSGDPHDYLSWAPYHWPNCNWCSNKGGNQHITNPSDGDGFDSSDPDYYNGPGDWGDYPDDEGDGMQQDYSLPPLLQRRMVRVRRDSVLPSVDVSSDIPVATGTPTSSLSTSSTTSETASTTNPAYDNTPMQAKKSPTPSSKCTPSPTKSLAPSATWTTCPYVVRDGQVNPDVRTLTAGPALTDMTQSVLYNAFAHALQAGGAASATSVYAQRAVNALTAFFIDSNTAIHPNVNFGQIVRGPGPSGKEGTFTGILDLRGMVRVINAIQVLKATAGTTWTAEQDKGMKAWVTKYVQWLETDKQAQKAADSPNNHGSFFVNQIAPLKLYLGDTQGAAQAVKLYFSGKFQDQIAQSGEQPFEAVRTRPYHYRAFNLEAMITNAKVGDELGLNFWTTKSKHGATIQTAVDFLIAQNPKKEDPLDAVPHVAAVAAAYGDPSGKYAAFLKRTQSNYQQRPYWFYDQSSAFKTAPATKKKRMVFDAVAPPVGMMETGMFSTEMLGVNGTVVDYDEGNAGYDAADAPVLSFECPAAFADATSVEIDDGIFVTCEELEPFYNLGL